MLLNKSRELSTPSFSKMVASGYVNERLEHDYKHLGDDWQNDEPEQCPKCKGTGKNVEFLTDPYCLNCDGTGTEYVLSYGIKDGEPFATVKEYGLDAKLEYAKASREAHLEQRKAGKLGTGIMPYIIPKTLEFELMARGYKPEQFYSGSYAKEIANIISSEYPEFLCVSYKNF